MRRRSRSADDFYNSFTDAPTAIEDRVRVRISELTTTPPPPSESSFLQDQRSTEAPVSSEGASTISTSSRPITPVSFVNLSITGNREGSSGEEDLIPLSSQPEVHYSLHPPSFSTFNLDEAKLTTREPLSIYEVRAKRVQISVWKDHLLDAARRLKAGRRFRLSRRSSSTTGLRANGDPAEPEDTSPEEMDSVYFDLNVNYLNVSLKYLSLVNDFAHGLGVDVKPPIWNGSFHETASILSINNTSSSEASCPDDEGHSTSHPVTDEEINRKVALQRRIAKQEALERYDAKVDALTKVLREVGLLPETGLDTPKRNHDDHTHRRSKMSPNRFRKMFERIRV
jgi:hypothetical protein